MSRNRTLGPTRVRTGVAIISVQALLALAVLVYLLAHEAVHLPFGASQYKVHAVFSDASGLKRENHAPVTIAGVPSGRVTDVVYRGGVAIATLELNRSVRGKLRDDAGARIVPRSALQDLTVDLSVGRRSAPALRAGATIPATRTSTTVGTDRVVGVLDADTRAQVQVLLGELALGTRRRAVPLRGGLARLGRLVETTTGVTRALDDRRALLTRLVGQLDTLFTTLGDRGQQLGGAIDAGRQTLDVTSARDRELADTVRELPASLARLGDAMGAVATLGPQLEPALARLRPFARELPAALRSLRDVVPAGRGLLADLQALARRGGPGARSLRRLLTELGPGAQALQPAAKDLGPVVAAIDAHKDGIGKLGDNFSGVFSTNDANGPILRGLGFFEPFNPADFGFPAKASGATLVRAQTETIRALTQVCLTENPLACLARYLVPGLPGSVAPLPLTAHWKGAHR